MAMYESLFSFPGGFAGDFRRLRDELDDLFGVVGMPTGIRSVAPGSFPAINVGNLPQSLEIYAFAPGIDSSKIEVTVDRGVLTLTGERPAALPANDAKVRVYSRERASGHFHRAVSLPDDADPSKVQANYRDGVLHVSVARREAPTPTRIAIQ
jgi:HSP20 family protein